MTAISKPWVTLTDAATDADSPVDQALVQGLRDDTVHLREWLGASYTAGAVQDHDHDGVNSALVPVGPNALRNGSFESGTTGWTLSAYTGGTLATNAANEADGAACLAITSTVLANGGGVALSDEYIPCLGGHPVTARWSWKGSVASISARFEVVWYDDTKTIISATQLGNTTSAPTTATTMEEVATAPATARFYQVRLTGGVPATGAATGTVYFDGIYAGALRGLVTGAATAATGTSMDFTGIPQWARHIVITYCAVTGTANHGFRVGTAAGIVSSGYSSNADSTYMFFESVAAGATAINGVIELWRNDAATDKWVGSWRLQQLSSGINPDQVSSIDLSAPLTQCRLYCGGGFGGGTITVAWE